MIDHVHTGFVIRTLEKLSEALNGSKSESAVDRGLDYYLRELFDKHITKFMPDITYPVNIHSVSEALLTLNQFRDHPLANQKLKVILPWAIEKFQDKII